MPPLFSSVLLVDDDAQILDTAQDILEAAGFAVRVAATGEAALRTLRDHPCRGMIVDFNLPDMTGLELARQAKSVLPEIVILLMTGEASVELGSAKPLIASILTKPVNPAQLIDIIHKIVEA